MNTKNYNFIQFLDTFKSNKSYTHWAKHNEKLKLKQRKSDLKSTDQIVKSRIIAEKKKQRQKKGKKKGKHRKQNVFLEYMNKV